MSRMLPRKPFFVVGGIAWLLFITLSATAQEPIANDTYLNVMQEQDRLDVNPSIATNNGGTWMAVWTNGFWNFSNDDDYRITMSVSTDNGQAWSAPAMIDTNITIGLEYHLPQLVHCNGDVWGMGYRSQSPIGGTASSLHFMRTLDNGDTWLSPITLTRDVPSPDANNSGLALSTDHEGTIMAVWESQDTFDDMVGTDYDIAMAISRDNGATWCTPKILNPWASTDKGSYDGRPDVATNGRGTWVVVWGSSYDLDGTMGTDHDIVYMVSHDDGETWSEARVLNGDASEDSLSDGKPVIENGSCSRWVASWTKAEDLSWPDTDIAVASSWDNGANWSSPTFVTTDRDSDYEPKLSTDAMGNWILSWWSVKDALVSFSHDCGSTWSAPSILDSDNNPSASTEVYPTSAAAIDGTLILAWNSSARGANKMDIPIARLQLPESEDCVDYKIPYACGPAGAPRGQGIQADLWVIVLLLGGLMLSKYARRADAIG